MDFAARLTASSLFLLSASVSAETLHCEAETILKGGGSASLTMNLTLKAGDIVALAANATESYGQGPNNPEGFWSGEFDTAAVNSADQQWTRRGDLTTLHMQQPANKAQGIGDSDVKNSDSVIRINQRGGDFVVYIDEIATYYRGMVTFPKKVSIGKGREQCDVVYAKID